MSDPTVIKSAKNLKRVAVALLLAAALLPFVVTTVGPPLHKEILRAIGNGFFWVVILYAAAATLMRSRPEIQQARIRVAIAACMLAWCGMLVAAGRVSSLRPESEPGFAAVSQHTDAILGGLDALIDRQTAARKALDARFAALDPDVLSPEHLTSAGGLASARAALEQHRALVRESDEFDRSALAAREAYVAGAAITDELRAALRAAVTSKGAASAQQLADARQSAMDHTKAVLDFAESRLGKSRLINGNLDFFRRADAVEYARLHAKVTVAALRENALMTRAPN